MRLNGTIKKKAEENFYFRDEDRDKNLEYEGEIESEDWKTYLFKYREVKFSLWNLQIGLEVSFDLTTDRNGNKIVSNIDKFPEDYGFLTYHDERRKKGYFRTYGKDEVEYYDVNVRGEDEPIYDSLYLYDTITSKRKKYDNSFYSIGEFSESSECEVGQKRKGIVKTVTSFGGFLNIGHLTSDGLLHNGEITWTDENVDPQQSLRIGQSIDVLITKIFVENGVTKIGLSAKALIEPPDETIIHYKATNIFRVSNMKTHIITEKVTEIANRDDILPEVKISAIAIIKDNPDLYKEHRNTTLPKLYDDCKKQLLNHIDNLDFDHAFPLLQEYATYDISILKLLEKFPEPFLFKLKSLSVDVDEQENEDDLDAFLFASNNNCSVADAREYLDISKDIFNVNNENNFELLKDRIGLEPSIILDEN
jgi:predicted RNA-binding protein with RPS1 domain